MVLGLIVSCSLIKFLFVLICGLACHDLKNRVRPKIPYQMGFIILYLHRSSPLQKVRYVWET